MSDGKNRTTERRQPEYGVEVCMKCDPVKPRNLVELQEPGVCPQCGWLLYGLLGTEIVDAE